MRKILRTKTEIHDFEPNINFCTGQPELRQKDAERDFWVNIGFEWHGIES